MARAVPIQEASRPGSTSSSTMPPKVRHLWFPWWVAFCLTLVAYNAHRQLEIQQRMLVTGSQLEQAVLMSGEVSAETNRQLIQVRSLARATERLDGRLAQVGRINGAIRNDLEALERLAVQISESVGRVEAETERSQALLKQILGSSRRLQETLAQSRRLGDQVSGHLQRLVGTQEGINADLAEINRKTRFLDRWISGE